MLRREEPRDHRAVEELTREAFWGMSRPRCDEHLLVHLLRKSPAFVPELDYVAEVDGVLVGNVMYSRACVVAPATGARHEVLTFGPLSVLPSHQVRGVGSALMRHTLREATGLGHRAVVVYGHPDYYPRLGFRPAAAFDITAPGGHRFDAHLAVPLVAGALNDVAGEFHEDPVFDLDPREVETFDRTFPPKRDAVLVPLAAVARRLPETTVRALHAHGIRHLEGMRRFSRAEVGAWEGMDSAACEALRDLLTTRGIRWGWRAAPR